MDYMYSWELPHVAAVIQLAEECAVTRRLVSAHEAASEIHRTAAITLREREEEYHRAVEKETGAQESAAFPTLDGRLVGVAKEKMNQLVQQKRHGIKAQHGKLIGLRVEIMVQLELQKRRQQLEQQEEKEEQVLEEVKVVQEEQEQRVEEKEVREEKEEQRNAPPPPPPWSVAEPDWWLDRMPPPQQQSRWKAISERRLGRKWW